MHREIWWASTASYGDYSVPIQTINNLMASMNKQIEDVIKKNVSRLKYYHF